MLSYHSVILGQTPDAWENLRLFQNPISTAGFIILAIFMLVLLVWVGVALALHIRDKQMERRPGVLGYPKQLLDELNTVADLTSAERYVLRRAAYRRRLPQPSSVLISPVLLVESAKEWYRTHSLSITRQWGIDRFDRITRKVYRQRLSQLAKELKASGNVQTGATNP